MEGTAAPGAKNTTRGDPGAWYTLAGDTPALGDTESGSGTDPSAALALRV